MTLSPELKKYVWKFCGPRYTWGVGHNVSHKELFFRWIYRQESLKYSGHVHYSEKYYNDTVGDLAGRPNAPDQVDWFCYNNPDYNPVKQRAEIDWKGFANEKHIVDLPNGGQLHAWS
jgi:hypothetical protein